MQRQRSNPVRSFWPGVDKTSFTLSGMSGVLSVQIYVSRPLLVF